MDIQRILDKAVKNLKEKGFVDFVVTHDGPRSFIKKYFGYTINDTPDPYLEKTETVRGERVHPGFVLDELYETPELYDYWYFGHHHDDIKGGKLRCLMHDMVLWDLKSNQYQIIKG